MFSTLTAAVRTVAAALRAKLTPSRETGRPDTPPRRPSALTPPPRPAARHGRARPVCQLEGDTPDGIPWRFALVDWTDDDGHPDHAAAVTVRPVDHDRTTGRQDDRATTTGSYGTTGHDHDDDRATTGPAQVVDRVTTAGIEQTFGPAGNQAGHRTAPHRLDHRTAPTGPDHRTVAPCGYTDSRSA